MDNILNLFEPIFEDPRHDDHDDTETPDPVQTQIPSHPGIKYPVSEIPPSDKRSKTLTRRFYMISTCL